jgi:uncharacterized membrane protein
MNALPAVLGIPVPDPLHPAVVHLPVALAVLMPLVAILALLAVRLGFLPARLWLGVVVLQAILVGSAWLAMETGEEQEDRVERVVTERFIEEHEEAAERFLTLCAVALGVVATGLLPGRRGAAGRVAGVVATVVVLAGAVPVGHSGGELVYRHGAAEAYRTPGAPGTAGGHAEHDD